ncbi:hypothetical protein ESZ91_02605 [Candidatus Borkfalkia ceftriaxoniphila]|uniref:PvuRts1 I-like SET and RING associated domain-containing protein n=1 Tax=Candidatus Borkfalkia ceftriaxoniphila TaxID=2508949 RepID=A0A4Q2K9Q7_9FIRM|nr:hypothetical protein [Candidatus Borkfalkia ceftriaxoniphila]RXZ61295.1 hypothetical protein ESZ91_02605 [Candidatus Borkfalkia ceftriaxoniphila]
MTNKKAWEIFDELRIENGEPFETQKIGETVCVVRQGMRDNIKILLDAEKGLFYLGSGKQGEWKQFNFDISDEEDFITCAEKVIAETVKQLNKKGVIHRGDVFTVSTNAQLLNLLLGKNMRGYMKCIYGLTDSYALLMHTFNQVTQAGWLNRELEDGTVIEQFVGNKKIFKAHEGLPDNRYRALFEKRREKGVFIFRGVYRLSDKSTSNRRVWTKVCDQTNLFDF